MGLRAVSPEVVPVGKPKFIFSGPFGSGKTWFSLNFPKPYFIDTEGGATRPEYKKRMKEVGAGYFGRDEGAHSFHSVVDEFKALATTKHDYKTVVLDTFTSLYLREAAEAELKVGNDFSKDKKEANKPSRQLMWWIEKIDMTVILNCHVKEKWKKKPSGELENLGTTFDGYDKMEGILDLWIELEERNNNRFFRVKKSRISTMPKGEVFPLDYEKFCDLYGKATIERDSSPIVLASPEQVLKIESLIDLVKVPKAEIEAWFNRADVMQWSEMKFDAAAKVIAHLEKRHKAINDALKENLS